MQSTDIHAMHTMSYIYSSTWIQGFQRENIFLDRYV